MASAAAQGGGAILGAPQTPEASSVYLARGADGILHIASEPVPTVPSGSVGAVPVLASERDRWANAWSGAKEGARIGAVVGVVLVAAGVAVDMTTSCADCFIPHTYVAAAVAIPVFLSATASGAIIGYIRGGD